MKEKKREIKRVERKINQEKKTKIRNQEEIEDGRDTQIKR